MSSRAVLEAGALHFSYSDAPILNGLDLTVRRGEIVGVLGPNGSGKTTLLKNLLVYLKPTSGSIAYYTPEDLTLDAIPHAADSRDLTPGRLAKLAALVPQRSGGGGSLTVYEMVMLGRLPHLESRWAGFSDLDRDTVECTMHGLGILRFRDRSCATLSGGEFQKVLLARALVQETEMLFLDEATANLDMHHAVEIMDLVCERADDERTVVAVMHDLNLAASYCDRVVLMKDGVVRYEGAPREVYRPEVIRDIFGVDLYLSEDEDGVPFVLPRLAGRQERTERSRAKEYCRQ